MKWSRFAELLGLTAVVEKWEDGKHPVLFGEMGEGDLTISSGGAISFLRLESDGNAAARKLLILEVHFTGGRDPGKVRKEMLEDEALAEACRAARLEPPEEANLVVDDQAVRLVLVGKKSFAGGPPHGFDAVVRALVEVAARGGLPRDGSCRRCFAEGVALGRWRFQTIRLCASCREELDNEPPPETEESGFSTLEIDPRVFAARQAALQAAFDRNPSGYWNGLIWWVLLGQAAMFSGALVLLLSLLLVAGIVWLLVATKLAVLLKLVIAKMLKLVIVAIVGIWILGRNVIKSLFWKPSLKEEYRLTRADLPRFFSWLDDLARRVGVAAPEVIVLDTAMNAAAGEYRRGWGRYERVVTVGIPVLETMTADELEAVMGHELGHLFHEDHRSLWVYRTAQGWIDTVRALEGAEGAGWLVRKFAAWYVPEFFLRAGIPGRAQEREADRKAAEATSGQLLGRALLKLGVLGRLLGEAVGDGYVRAARSSPAVPTDLATLWREELLGVKSEKLRKARQEALDEAPHWLDSHPVLRERLELLGVEREDPEDLLPAPEPRAAALVDGYAEHRDRVLGKQREGLKWQFRWYHRRHQALAGRAAWLESVVARESGLAVPARVELARSTALRGVAHYPEAAEHYQRALAADPDHWTARRELVSLCALAEKWKDAVEHMEALANKFPDEIDTLLQGAEVFEKAQVPQRAAAMYQKLLAADLPPAIRAAFEEKISALSTREGA